MEPFKAAPHPEILVLLVQIALLLFTARLFGEILRKLGQPSVIGEILAGIVLGPSLLSSIFPAFGAWFIPSSALEGYLLETISMLGAMFLMLITGFETDLSLIRRHARTAISVSLGGIIVSFIAGFLIGQRLPEVLIASPDRRMVFALFLGTAMSISAIAVIAKVIIDLKLTRRDVGQTIIAAAMSDDTIGWILLSVVTGLATGKAVTVTSIATSLLSVLGLFVLSLTAGRWLIRKLLDFVSDRVRGTDVVLSVVILLMFLWGALTHAMHFEVVLGAFIVGIILGEMRRIPHDVIHQVESFGLSVFAPIFFAVAGLKVNLAELANPQLLGLAGIVIGTTVAAKLTGNYLGARLVGRRGHWSALSFGFGLNTRGAMDIIIATIGLSLSIFSREMFSIIVLMAIVTALTAPFALRWALRHVKPSREEAERLKREEMAEGSIVANIHRILLPIRLRGANDNFSGTESVLISMLAEQNDIELTLLTVARKGEKAAATTFLDSIEHLFPTKNLTKKVVEATSPSEAILDEAVKGYDLLVLGATQDSSWRVLFNPMVDYLLRVSPCPTMVVKATGQPGWKPKRILVPTNGALPARRAAELAFSLAAAAQGTVTVVNAVMQRNDWSAGEDTQSRRAVMTAKQLVEDLREMGEAHGVETNAEVRVSGEAETAILQVAREQNADLIILGTDLRPGSDRLFLGTKVERLLNEASCPVVIFNAG